MPYPRYDASEDARDRRSDANFELALVVGASQINRIVVSRIAQRAGLKVIDETPERACAALLANLPGTVIIEMGPDERDFAELMECLAAQRLAAGRPAPFVIVVSSTTAQKGAVKKGGVIDAIVAKPITPESLQPLIQSMMDRVRD